MLKSIDCMLSEWTNCPKSLHGQFMRRGHKYLTLILKAVADYKLWILHAFFGVPMANNDLNVLYGSQLFDDLLANKAPEAPFVVNGKTYNKCYYLADGIYPTRSTFVKTYSIARGEKNNEVEKSSRKDIERAFGVLQAKSTDVVEMALPVQNINHSAIQLVLRVEKKMHVIEQPLPPAPEPVAEPNVVDKPKGNDGSLSTVPPEKQKLIVARNSKEEDTTPSEITTLSHEVEGFEPPQEEVDTYSDLNEPTSYKAAMLDLESNKVCKTVGSKWLFKKKTDMDGIVHVYKARLIAKGYTQLYGVDYEETFSPVADIRAIRILISIAAYYDYEIWQMDDKFIVMNEAQWIGSSSKQLPQHSPATESANIARQKQPWKLILQFIMLMNREFRKAPETLSKTNHYVRESVLNWAKNELKSTQQITILADSFTKDKTNMEATQHVQGQLGLLSC
ncbi:retrotransposon protein, putative, ty1-copia subclass [Tanacetum coccineum]